MNPVRHSDGNILAGFDGFVTSMVSNKHFYRIVLVIGALGAAAGWAFVPGVWETFREAQRADPPQFPIWQPILVTLASLFATALPLLAALKKDDLDRELADNQQAERAEIIVLLNSFLSPTIEKLPLITHPRDGAATLDAVRVGVMNAAQTVCGPQGSHIRVVWFGVNGRTMHPVDWVGGNCNSNRKFTKDRRDRAGSEAWRVARLGTPKLYTDVINQPPPHYEKYDNSSYQTFITCGALDTSGEVVGMLNVDATYSGDLGGIDMTIVHLCARILGVAHSLSAQSTTV